ncbi:flavodoxin domain-containing protein [Herpetosiphon sp.]|uniref:Flavodoxin n=1 Tax=Herpetosiphon aurantiacus (strain ATCC 23779 / DSM 785 / 114-95) TaxID=316274 RepID=A9B6N3_HERA2|nr:flavodoxin domain-containing protein [Herpetosiphon sp.]ABX04342.1 flavodoxin [Herpetosiphon aurantiacus DSM 785]
MTTRSILVTYASRGGSTMGVAKAIATVLTEQRLPVTLLPMQQVKHLNSYQAVVAGSPIHKNRWLPEALAFVKEHQIGLRTKPFAAFLTCLALAMTNQPAKTLNDVAQWLQPVRHFVQPCSEGLFAGVLDLSKISLGYRLLFRGAMTVRRWREGDYRNWHAIEAWAATLPTKFSSIH